MYIKWVISIFFHKSLSIPIWNSIFCNKLHANIEYNKIHGKKYRFIDEIPGKGDKWSQRKCWMKIEREKKNRSILSQSCFNFRNIFGFCVLCIRSSYYEHTFPCSLHLTWIGIPILTLLFFVPMWVGDLILKCHQNMLNSLNNF